MEDERIPKKNFNEEFQNTRSVRKPGKMRYRSYEYEVEGTDLGVQKNGGLLKEPRAQKGLWRHTWIDGKEWSISQTTGSIFGVISH